MVQWDCMMSKNLNQKISSMTERQLREVIREVLMDELAPLRGRFYSPEELVTRNEFQAFIRLLDERHQSLIQLMNQRFEAQNQRFETLQKEMNQRFEAQNQRFETLQRSIDRNFKWTSLMITVFTIVLSILAIILRFSLP